MKKFILVVCAIVMVSTTFAQTDTIVNNGDGKVVIIDKRPRTVINKQPLPSRMETGTVVVQIPEDRALESYLYYKAVGERNPLVQNNADNSNSSDIFIAFLAITILGVMAFMLGKAESPNSIYRQSQPAQPMVFHIHGANSSSVIDGSETAYSHTTYQRPIIPPIIIPFNEPTSKTTMRGTESVETGQSTYQGTFSKDMGQEIH